MKTEGVKSVYLRPLTIEDAAVSWKWRNNPKIWGKTIDRPDRQVTEEMERAWAEKVLADPQRKNFAICLSATDRYIGNVYLIGIHDGITDGSGIFIGEEDCHGHGYGEAAWGLLLDEAAKLGIKEVRGLINLINTASVRMSLRNGAHFQDPIEAMLVWPVDGARRSQGDAEGVSVR